MTLFQQIALVVGMTAVTVLSRNLFLLSRKAMPLPARVKIALRFAPAAAKKKGRARCKNSTALHG